MIVDKSSVKSAQMHQLEQIALHVWSLHQDFSGLELNPRKKNIEANLLVLEDCRVRWLSVYGVLCAQTVIFVSILYK